MDKSFTNKILIKRTTQYLGRCCALKWRVSATIVSYFASSFFAIMIMHVRSVRNKKFRKISVQNIYSV